MTEADWQGGTDPWAVLARAAERGLGERQLRFLALAWARPVLPLLPDVRLRRATEAAERLAEGLLSEAERWPILHDAVRATHEVPAALRLAARVAVGTLDHVSRYRVGELGDWVRKVVTAQGLPAARPAGSSPRPHRQAAGRAKAEQRRHQCELARCILGNPFRPAAIGPDWLARDGGPVERLAREAYAARELPSGELSRACLAVLADALEERGCAEHQILTHLRGPGEHHRGCFAVDAVLRKG